MVPTVTLPTPPLASPDTKTDTGKLAIILAGGLGTRLKPYTIAFPKALVPLGEMPVLELVLRQLKLHGFTQIILSVGHLSHLIEAYFGNGNKLGLSIEYAREETPLGTAGPIKTIENLPANFLVMNADIVSDIPYSQLFEQHQQNVADCGTLATIATYKRTSKIDFGVIEANSNNRIERFIEKPVYEHAVSMGIYLFNRNIVDHIPSGRPFGFDQLMHTLIEQQVPANVFPFGGYWLDIGRVDDYEKATQDFEELKKVLLPETLPKNDSATVTV